MRRKPPAPSLYRGAVQRLHRAPVTAADPGTLRSEVRRARLYPASKSWCANGQTVNRRGRAARRHACNLSPDLGTANRAFREARRIHYFAVDAHPNWRGPWCGVREDPRPRLPAPWVCHATWGCGMSCTLRSRGRLYLRVGSTRVPSPSLTYFSGHTNSRASRRLGSPDGNCGPAVW